MHLLWEFRCIVRGYYGIDGRGRFRYIITSRFTSDTAVKRQTVITN